jgi:serine/threonine-protein kinase RsbW
MGSSFEMTIGSDIGEIPAVFARLEEAMGAGGFSPEEILDTQLAVEEVLTNIIIHGYKRSGCRIELEYRPIRDGIEIRVTDSAPRFDPLSVTEPEPEGTLDQRRIGGLGIFLVRHVMDELSYRYEGGKNVLTMVKRRTS